MAEYIEREALIKNLCNRCDGWCDNCDCDCLNCTSEHRCDPVVEISNTPAADVVEVRHEVWLHHRTDDNGIAIVKCSACNAKRYGRSLYCPNCGADMRGDKNGK